MEQRIFCSDAAAWVVCKHLLQEIEEIAKEGARGRDGLLSNSFSPVTSSKRKRPAQLTVNFFIARTNLREPLVVSGVG